MFVALGLKAKKYIKGLKDSGRATKNFEKRTTASARTVKDAFSDIGKALAAGIIVNELKKLGLASISAASDLQEVGSKFDTVFAGMERDAESWADTLQDFYAMSTRASKQYLSSVQDLLVPMGMQSQAAANMSNEVVKLSADLGSFNNLPTAQVIGDIQSALVGNFETMKKYGVVLNAANVQQKALGMGLAATKQELTAAHKAQAAFNLIVAGSSAAVGDMERTSDSYANVLKTFTSAVEDAKAEIGKLLLPAATAGLKDAAITIDTMAEAIKISGQASSIAKEEIQEWTYDNFAASTVAKKEQSVLKQLSKGFRTIAISMGIAKREGTGYFDAVINADKRWLTHQDKKLEVAKKLKEERVDAAPSADQAVTAKAVPIDMQGILSEFDKMDVAWTEFWTGRELEVIGFNEVFRTHTMSEFELELDSIAKKKELWTQAGADKVSIEKVISKQMENVNRAELQNRLATTQKYLGNIVGIGRTLGKKGFAFSKAAGIANATISMHTGAAEALKLPFPYNIAAAGTVLAYGAGQIAQIKGQKFHSGGVVPGAGERSITALGGEGVVSPQGMASIGGAAGLNSINAGDNITNKPVFNFNFPGSVGDSIETIKNEVLPVIVEALSTNFKGFKDNMTEGLA